MRDRKRTLVAALVAAAAVLPLSASPAAAIAVQRDAGFAPGFETIDVRGTNEFNSTVAIDSSGNIVIGTISDRTTDDFGDYDSAFVRLTTTGALDSTFGTGGRKIVALPVDSALAGFAIAPGNKIVGLAFGSGGTEYLFRLNADGTFDTSTDSDPASHFGTNGVVTLPGPGGTGHDAPQGVVVGSDGRVVIASTLQGSSSEKREVRVRGFLATGAFDFDSAVTVGAGDTFVQDVALSPDGSRVALLGDSESSQHHAEMSISVFDTTFGDPDPTFSGDGKFTIVNGTHDLVPSRIAFRFDGEILASGLTSSLPDDFDGDLVLLLHTDGTLDHDYGHLGVAKTDSVVQSITGTYITTTGRTMLTGSSLGTDVGAVALDSHGNLATAFGGAGSIRLDLPLQFFPTDGVPSTNARTVLVGPVSPLQGNGSDIGVLRITGSGTGDPTFGDTAFTDYALRDEADHATAVAIAPDGGAVVAGRQQVDGVDQAAVITKLLPSGFRDPAFAFRGSQLVAVSGITETEASAVAMSGDKAVFGGCAQCSAGGSTFFVGRLKKNGNLDTAFSGDGVTTSTFASGPSEANGVAVLPDGRVIAVGRAGTKLAIARYTAAGDPDTTFGGGDGQVTTAIGDFAEALDVAIQTNGRIVVVGTRTVGMEDRMFVARYMASGGLDASFHSTGIALVSFGASTFSEGRGVAIRSDGRVVAVGETFDGTSELLAIARYLPDGTLDAAFDGDGKLATDLGGIANGATDVASSGSKIVIVGSAAAGGHYIARLLGSGAPDTTFSGDGIEAGPFDSNGASGVALQSDGAAVVVGDGQGIGGTDQLVIRYKP